MLFVLGFTSVCVLLATCGSYSSFQEQIPNGNKVPHPCKINYRWPGVGHNNPLGGGARNPFGVDFQNAGFKWTVELCQHDSDGDGRTNGDELGDPKCIWSGGQGPSRKVNITNPGVCDPFDSPPCRNKNSFLSCALDSFEGCDAIKKPTVTFIDLRFNETEIPATVTNYLCQTFEMQRDSDYHIIANEALIDNSEVLHHMLVFACKDDRHYVIGTPSPCFMVSEKCSKIISAWTVGLSGQCFGPTAGYRIGRTGHKKVMLQIHYNNPFKVENYTDSSGIRLYIQPSQPEVQNMATFTTGQSQLMLPPGQKSIQEIGVCTESSTNMLINTPIYVMAAANHMHYMGRSMTVELFRNGVKIANITNDDFYNYDSPVTHNHKPPIEIRPGDEIRTTCVYSSLNIDHYVTFGMSTDDEMCFAFMYVYPLEAFTDSSDCTSIGPLSTHDHQTGQPYEGCHWVQESSFLYNTLSRKCSLTGFCRPECRTLLMTLKDHPCLNGKASTFFKTLLAETNSGVRILGWLHSCNLDNTQTCPKPDGNDGSDRISAITTVVLTSAAVFILLV